MTEGRRKKKVAYPAPLVVVKVPLFTHFPSIGSDDLGVENVKIQENSEKIRGPLGDP